MTALPRAHGASVLDAVIRSVPEDFRVEEVDAFAPSGQGEHLLLTIERRGMTTAFATSQIARWAGVAESAIGVAGLKDRHAVTRQRFSVWLPRRVAPDVAALANAGLQVLAAEWHARKLPRGALAGNRFTLVLRQVQGSAADIEARLHQLLQHGVPNYFGEQRFGRGGDNLAKALAMFAGRRVRRQERSLLLSAARSELFNRVLAQRVRRGDWNRALDWDVWMLEGSRSVFGPEPVDDGLRARIEQGDIHPTGPLWGRGALRTQHAVQALEQAEADALPDVCRGLESAGLTQERRSLRLPLHELAWAWPDENTLQLAFLLPPGAYATTVLHALGDVTDAQRD